MIRSSSPATQRTSLSAELSNDVLVSRGHFRPLKIQEEHGRHGCGGGKEAKYTNCLAGSDGWLRQQYTANRRASRRKVRQAF